MLIDGRVHAILNLEDLNSDISFRDWLVKNLSLYHEKKDVSDKDIRTFLTEYIIPKLSEIDGEVRNEWDTEIRGILGPEEKSLRKYRRKEPV
ncbi:hypothetical protein CMI47_09045 [Candidatus Pacearchaeota archaeon]|nr:hypothetical protein [Candidatus Pacearchaeota archaeon]|tara:strand:+ start:1834 stop:2109 length:276 start_codon:yes stop_codon:yes gene_type:complete